MTPVTLLTPDDVYAAIARMENHDDANLLHAYIQQVINTIERLREQLDLEKEIID